MGYKIFEIVYSWDLRPGGIRKPVLLSLSLFLFKILKISSEYGALNPHIYPLILLGGTKGKLWKSWEYQTTWPASWETCMEIRKQQLELDMEQQTGSK